MLVATTLDSTDSGHSHRCRKPYWTALVQRNLNCLLSCSRSQRIIYVRGSWTLIIGKDPEDHLA